MSRTFHPLSILLTSAALVACGGSSSETPPPLEPDPARLGKPPAAPPSASASASASASSRDGSDAPRERHGEPSNAEKLAPPTIGEPASPY